jgi:SAM-dependent methyltransferase
MKCRIIDLGHLRQDSGHCWVAEMPNDMPHGEMFGMPDKSTLRLFEDGIELGPGSSPHEWVRQHGKGFFSHWGSEIYFSASDNADPSKTGRRYQALVPDPTLNEVDLKDLTRLDAGVPVNYKTSTYDANKLMVDAQYAMAIAENYVATLPKGRDSLQGKSVLELGPGQSFGTVMVLRALGARSASVADRFLARFDPEYHPNLYRLIAQLLVHKYPDADTSILMQAAERGHDRGIVYASEKPLEQLFAEFKDIDITLSNAVFEHLYDQLEAIKVLHQITSTDGIGLHQVDFRDHRDFARPLEYLLMSETEFSHLFSSVHGECGGQARPFQMERMFHIGGFSQVEFHPNEFVDSQYLEEVIQKLQRIPENLYGYIPKNLLAPISGQFRIKKC